MTQHLFEQRNHPETQSEYTNKQPVGRVHQPTRVENAGHVVDQKKPDGQRSFILRRFLHIE